MFVLAIPRSLPVQKLTIPPRPAEELSEEDQQLKSELDMLVERLTVCLEAFRQSCVGSSSFLGVENIPLQAYARGHEGFHQNIHIIDDRRTEATQVSQAAL